MSEEKLIEVYRAKDSPQAHMLTWILEDAGIWTLIDGDEFAGALGDLTGWASAPRIMVRESDAPQARILLEQWENTGVARTTEA